jgi:hypothetical protein
MSREKNEGFKSFLEQNGYFLVLTVVCGLGLFSYFYASGHLQRGNQKQVLGSTSSIRGVWVKAHSAQDCKGSNLINADACITDEYFNEYEKLPIQKIDIDRHGRVVFSNDHLFISGIFDMREFVNDEIWSNLQIGSLNLKINNRQWVFEDVVSSREDINSLLSIAKTQEGYLIIMHPSVTLTGRGRQIWVFEYFTKDGSIEKVYFDDGGRRAFVESTYAEVLKDGEELLLKLVREDPSLSGSKEVNLYEFDEVLTHRNTFLLQSE